MIRNTRRSGVTLLEVLAAIFIMGVGLLAILVLFPLGALSMARAVRDDRAAAIGANAGSQGIALDLQNDPNIVGLLASAPPLPLDWTVAPPGWPAPPPAEGPGYAVFVDPHYASTGIPNLSAIGDVKFPPATNALQPTPGLPRVTPDFLFYIDYLDIDPNTNLPRRKLDAPRLLTRYFTFQDEITFLKNGRPMGPTNLSVTRPGTYTFAYLVRRPRPLSPALTEIKVLVYANRRLDTPTKEQVVYATNPPSVPLALAGSSTIDLDYSAYGPADKPTIRKGSWLLDTSYVAIPGGWTVTANFYQVASATDTGPTSYRIETETPFRNDITTIVAMENLITVLDRGTGWRP